ncbi:hypothetical protein [Thalassobacterium sedimentorum]|nr:hypothetical protein [Coraliomargarita sp. SDUM461004]
MERLLGELPTGGTAYPVKLVFNSNPADAPGAFGPYWRIPLFGSTVVQYKQYNLYWDGPDERRQFFTMDRGHASRRGEKLFNEHGKDWTATIARNGEVLIQSAKDADWYFRYDNGLLKEFKLGAAATTSRITYTGRGLPLYVTEEGSSRRVFEIEYRGATDPERIIIGDSQIAVEMGDAELTAPDGVSNYRNYRVSFLRSLAPRDGEVEYFSYSKSDSLERKVALLDQAEKKVIKTLNLAVNRMEISSDLENPEAGNWIEWEAKSGFIASDSGSSYKVNNDSWDPNIQDAPQSVTPTSVEIARLPIGGEEQKWSYGWKSGVRVYTDLATGETVRRTMIMSGGPASGKLRKREVFKDGKWVLDRQNSYDPKGRPIRAVHGDSMRIWKWEDTRDGSEATEYLNGNIVRRTVYDVAGEFVEREIFKADGDVDKYVYGSTEVGKTVTYFVNGEPMTYKELDAQGRMSYMKWANGKEQYHSRENGIRQIVTVFSDGRKRLVERVSDSDSFVQVESTEIVSQTLEVLRNRRAN